MQSEYLISGQKVNKLTLWWCIILQAVTSCSLLAISIYSFIQYYQLGYLLNVAIIAIVSFAISILFPILMLVWSKSKQIQSNRIDKVHKSIKYSMMTLILFSTAILIGTIVYTILTMSSIVDKLYYGPLAFIHEDSTRIHWATFQENISGKNAYNEEIYDSTDFDYKLKGFKQQYSYKLPETINRFIVMTDIHLNNHYISTMSTDYDYAVLCGDYSYHGLMSEFAEGLLGMPTKPLLMAKGNHDDYSDEFIQLNGRQNNYFQKVRNTGFYFIYVQDKDPIVDERVDSGIQFIADNIHLGTGLEHIFIVVHYPVYSTGEFGSYQYFTKKMENLIQNHPELKVRATFSGHDHLFAAFKNGAQYFFVNGAGGGSIDQMTDASYGDRKWPAEELHGALPIVAENDYGYEHHQDSWMKFTRTEVNFEQGKIVYNIRDLDTNQILVSYQQPV
ncbi:Alkaline_phosphatase [Hexamita inflata]|uniref:Alkaline phosphatase n=1 Tax=Hexamita inflata TaxID=28002 RepID=A0AA86TXJ2_9EUKA|nr:Alkaline phosphatase [Hexamita inflata]